MTRESLNRSLGRYDELLKSNGLVIKSELFSFADSFVSGITYDSRAVKSGFIFVCKGAAFKKEFLQSALRAGCLCYISEIDYNLEGVPNIIVNDIREAMPLISKMFYDIPDDFKVVGITGTKGKTTTAYYLKAIFDEEARSKGGSETAFITTVETYDGKERISTGITTPESFELYRHFRNACDAGLSGIVIEVSSQALKYKRTAGIDFSAAVFLNISEDHISPVEHPDFEDYFKSKLKIFEQCKAAFVCIDSDYVDEILNAAKKAEKTVTFGFKPEADLYAYNIKQIDSRTSFSLRYKGRDYDFDLNMRGRFNVENALAALAVAFGMGVSYEDAYKAFQNVSVPGRSEEYTSFDGQINVIVDYAHNGLSFRNIINTARERWPEKRIVTVFGSPGGKGLNRRRDMGTAAGELSDYIYLTADDPANERVEDICAQIAEYVSECGCPCEIIADRKEAVIKAILGCKEPSVVLVLGKGAETAQKVGNKSQSYESDAVVVREALDKLQK